ncbi:NADH dehydrogenase 1 beta subcomplex subunit 7 ndufb7, partial [Halocaridina rubra]
MIATKEEMESAKLPLEDRDYCAHYLIKHMTCRKEVFPLVYKCAHEKHEFLNCQYEE